MLTQTNSNRIGVMQLTDTLGAGGAERVAVNVANLLPRDRYRPYLCTTREEGALSELVAADVGQLHLGRKRRFDRQALGELVKFIQAERIQVLHAHTTSVFFAAMASLRSPYPKVVWHDHYGSQMVKTRPTWLYRQVTRRVSGVIAVNQILADWAQHSLRMPANRVWYVPNFTVEAGASEDKSPALPGTAGQRIVCVANFRRAKDHFTLLQAMSLIVRKAPAAQLLLVGVKVDLPYVEEIRREIGRLNLTDNVALLGERRDVTAILRASDIGVLSSASEGLPLALIEYGMAGLPAVTTQVGQCGEVLDDGRAGVLVPARAPDRLAAELLTLLRSPQQRAHLGQRFHRRVKEHYSPGPIVRQICNVYDAVTAVGSAGKKG